MPFVTIEGAISFATNHGVIVEKAALDLSPERLYEFIHIAYSHINDDILTDACCGGRGLLAAFHTINFQDYLQLKEDYRITSATRSAKQVHTSHRRKDFNSIRSDLVLALIDSGVKYVCAASECSITDDLTIDHVIPLSRGGSDDLENLQFLCRPHNSTKGDSQSEVANGKDS